MKDYFIYILSGALVGLGKYASQNFEGSYKELVIYVIGSIITGALFSSAFIWVIEERFGDLPVIVDTSITSFVTIFGFLTLVRLIKNETISKFFENKINKK